MQSVFNLTASGVITATFINYKGEQRVMTSNNAVLSLFKEVLCKLAANMDSGKIDQLKVSYQGLLLATTPIVTWEKPDVNKVMFSAIFSEASFNGNFDKLELVSSGTGAVAKVEDITWGIKPPNEQLAINWAITILG